jgi:methylamine dehydrogenase heavy chain
LAAAAALVDDGRFLVASNFTPAQSVTVVDRKAHKVTEEFNTPGCGLVYPVGERKFMVHCSDGALALATLDDAGKVTLGPPGKPLSKPEDAASEKPVRIGKQKWLFVTEHGNVKVVDASTGVPTVSDSWALTDDSSSGWRPGGLRPMAFHRATNELFVLMHEGGDGTHKDPGTQIWVYDIAKKSRIRVIKLKGPATAIDISSDNNPLLYAVMFGVDGLTVIDPVTGDTRRTVSELGATLSLVQAPAERW